jgi:predicted nicotinamide N-methyase
VTKRAVEPRWRAVQQAQPALLILQQLDALQVQELDWTKPEQLGAFQAPYDLVLATDCVYHEHLVHDLLRVMLHCAGPKTTGE